MAATQRIPVKNEAGARSTIDDGSPRVDPNLSADGIMPDPLSGSTKMSKADADDLIASIADQQIDAMLGDDAAADQRDVEPTQNAAELAVNATEDLQAVAEELTAQASADLMSDLSKAAQEALDATPASDVIADATNEALGATNEALGATTQSLNATPSKQETEPDPLAQDNTFRSVGVAEHVDPPTPSDAAMGSTAMPVEANAAADIVAAAVVATEAPRVTSDVATAIEPTSVVAEPEPKTSVASADETNGDAAAEQATSVEAETAQSIAVEPTATDVADAPEAVAADLIPKADGSSSVAEPHVSADPSVPVDVAALSDLAPAVSTADASEINQDEIDALITGGVSPLAAEPSSETAPSHAADVAHALDETHAHESSADAVAREMAEDARHALADLPTMDVPPPANRTLAAVQTAIMLVLTWVNFPIRHFSDGARELIGIVGIVTLVNAMALLLYLMIFG